VKLVTGAGTRDVPEEQVAAACEAIAGARRDRP
jgi:hypothetical protein